LAGDRMNLQNFIEKRVSAAMAAAGIPGTDPIVVTAAKPEFGDYQVNGCMAAAKPVGINPRKLAEQVVLKLDLSGIAESVGIAGPGFINITLDPEWLSGQLEDQSADRRLGLPQADKPLTIVVDYSSPNLAKEMHVGHLRSTIIGDAMVRILDFCGHDVIRQNHVGDWGTQFGMLLAFMKEQDLETSGGLSDLEEFYRSAKKKFDEDPDFADAARHTVLDLQSGNKDCLELWQRFLEISLEHCHDVYRKLGVLLQRADVRGESFYRDGLATVISDLENAGILSESNGARCVFPEGFYNKKNEPLGVIVRKSDGGYLYTTTDLAAIKYRVGKLHAKRILYVTDSRQADHFAQVFAIAKMARLVPEGVVLEHVPFGMMLGSDGKPFKTRSGGTLKLADLVNEAIDRAGELATRKNPEIEPEKKDEISRAIGRGALKYADLSQGREKDYIFSWERMLTLDGNTAPYMQYAYARIRSIFRKADTDQAGRNIRVAISEPAERTLAVMLLRFPETVVHVASSCHPHVLCAYLYDLAGVFMRFYETCPVLKADTKLRESRLCLCDLTARVIKTGLNLLGIETVEKM